MCSGIVLVVHDYIVVLLSLYMYYYTAKLYAEQFILRIGPGSPDISKYMDWGEQKRGGPNLS